MAYGRLDVFWPDGKFESFLLETPSVSVGRSSGCTIVLDTDTISRYHLSITNKKGEVTVTDLDSANGTYVDGVQLNSNEARRLQDGEELQIGHLRLIYHHLEENQATVPVARVPDDTQRIERQDMGFAVEVYGPAIAIPPGSHTSMEISINNLAKQKQRYIVKVTGLPDGWARVNRPELEVDSQDFGLVLVNIKPFRVSESAPGNYPVQVEVALKSDPEKKIEVEVPVRILPYSGFGMALASRRITAAESFRLHVHNQGSIGLPLYIIGRSKDNVLSFGISKPQVLLAPGQRTVIQGVIKPARRRLFGATRDHAFDVMVRSRDEASFLAAERGHYIETAILPRWAAAVIAVLAFGAVVFMMAGLVLLLSRVQPEPAILAFEASVEQIPRGNLLGLSWTAEDAGHFTIRVNDVPVREDIPADVNTIEIETGELTGQISIVLEAVNRDRSDEATVSVLVYEPLFVEYFEVVPAVLVRNVVQQITISWRVHGATLTQIDGLDSCSQGQVTVEPSYGAEGTLVDVPGIPTDNFTITLYAEGTVGDTLEQAVNVDLINPQCVTTEDGFTLHVSPDMTANVVSTVPQDVTLVVDRRDESGQWLRTRLEGGVFAWGARTGLDCAATFNPDNLKIEIVEPPPTPTAVTTPVTETGD
jgi:hypothetical protein